MKTYRGVDHDSRPKAADRRRRQQQPRIGDEIVIVEGDLDTVRTLRYSTH